MLTIFHHLPLLHRALICCFSAIIIIAVFLLPDPRSLRTKESLYEVGRIYPIAMNPDSLSSPKREQHNAIMRWETHKVRSGESASVLFSRLGLSPRLLHTMVTSDEAINKQLSRLRPNDELVFGYDDQNNLIQLQRQISAYETFKAVKDGDKFKAVTHKKEVNVQLNYAEASISSSFWNAAIDAQLTPNQIMSVAGIFGWDIDFALDIRPNDSFKLLFEEKIVEGEFVGYGRILAAQFTNQGDSFTAILDDESGNYYDEKGRAMKKAFLRSPVDFRRVTSNFNPNRRHPVTGKIRAHRGTDYAAPVGTPIYAAGDGVVLKSGYNQFNGNYVFIKHSNIYITKYLHLQKRRVKGGQRVKQGQTIGTLGGTGRVTGPHLHYEFLVNGVHKNARTVKLPEAKSLSGNKKKTFMTLASQRLDELKRYQHLLTASIN
ncbi:peptidoglycan DD-metalloendopeptidase family protein [Vibrio rarus]|uniref:peptidoglycan DD-metalloendopeptidase family protein n=1 Tax=Vibrio rarus TaxID=413403 RepID=UPI0021C2AA7B|nr:peptidoglycan DD-metalloendopeptidase family protein [Vibrio rarus]